jgi:ribonuclease HI
MPLPVSEKNRAGHREFGGSEGVLWTDGAARGNPGPAGIGAILKTPTGEILSADSAYLGEATNNVAEYKALLMGLERALERGITRIEVRADSELLIKQLSGHYRVRNARLKGLFDEAKRLLARFETTKLVHVRRELNAEADRLANAGIDSRPK